MNSLLTLVNMVCTEAFENSDIVMSPQPMESMMIETSAAIQEVAALSAKAAEIAASHDAVMAEIRAKRESARGDAIQVVQEIVGQFSLSAADIKLHVLAKAVRAKRGEKKARGVVAAKYRSPDGTLTWSGRGRHPVWFAAALAAGQSADSMLIQTAQSA